MNAALLADTVTTTYVALPSLDGIKNQIITFVSSLIVIILIVRLTHIYAKKNWGEIIPEVLALCLAIYVIFNPDTAIQDLKDLVAGA